MCSLPFPAPCCAGACDQLLRGKGPFLPVAVPTLLMHILTFLAGVFPSCLCILAWTCLGLASLPLTASSCGIFLMGMSSKIEGPHLCLLIANIQQASPQIPSSWKCFRSLSFGESARNATYKCERFHFLRSTVYFKSLPYLSIGKLCV